MITEHTRIHNSVVVAAQLQRQYELLTLLWKRVVTFPADGLHQQRTQ